VSSMRFQAHVADRVNAVVAFVNDVGFFNRLVRIADCSVDDFFFRRFRRASCFQILLVDDEWFLPKGNFDRSYTVFGDVSGFGSDGGYDVAIPVAVVAFVLKQVDSVNAGDLLCRFDIQASDRRLGVFTGEQASVERAFLIHVCGVFGKAGSFVDTVEPSRLGPDQFVGVTRPP